MEVSLRYFQFYPRSTRVYWISSLLVCTTFNSIQDQQQRVKYIILVTRRTFQFYPRSTWCLTGAKLKKKPASFNSIQDQLVFTLEFPTLTIDLSILSKINATTTKNKSPNKSSFQFYPRSTHTDETRRGREKDFQFYPRSTGKGCHRRPASGKRRFQFYPRSTRGSRPLTPDWVSFFQFYPRSTWQNRRSIHEHFQTFNSIQDQLTLKVNG